MNIFYTLIVVIGLAVFETICSIDNAIINADRAIVMQVNPWLSLAAVAGSAVFFIVLGVRYSLVVRELTVRNIDKCSEIPLHQKRCNVLYMLSWCCHVHGSNRN